MKNRYAVVLWIAALLPCRCQAGDCPTGSCDRQPAPTWTIDQAVTCSVHDAWELGGKNRAGIFCHRESDGGAFRAKARPCFPDRETDGREFGDYIKTQARADRDQLLYAIVDRAVRKYGTAPPAGGGK